MAKEHVGLDIPLYGLASGVETSDGGARGVEWRHSGSPAVPGVTCCISAGASLRFATTLQGTVRFFAGVALEDDGPSPDSRDSAEFSISVLSRRGQIVRQCTRRIDRSGGKGEGAAEEWKVSLGRFRGEPIEITLSLATPGGEPRILRAALRNPALRVEPPLPVSLARLARKALSTLRAEGMSGIVCELARVLDPDWGHRLRYRFWLGREGRGASAGARGHSEALDSEVLTSVLIDVGADASHADVLRLLDSVAGQSRANWEILAVVGPSHDPTTLPSLRRRAHEDHRIRVLEAGEDCAQALNRALDDATGTFVVLLRPEGELAAGALAEVTDFAQRYPEADVIYSDEDRRDARGRRSDPFFKPDWSSDDVLSYPYVGHLCVFRTALARALGGFRSGICGAEDFDLLLRLQRRAREIRHVPRVLWHRRSESSPGLWPFARNEAIDRRVVGDYLKETGADAEVTTGLVPGTCRVKWRIQGSPLVSIIIPTRDRIHLLRRCLAGILERTAYRNVEVVVVDNASVEPETLEFLASCGARVVRDPEPFNFARLCNVGVRHTRGEHLLFLNNDAEPCDAEWLSAMLELSQRETVGAVGAKLYYPDGRIQHLGIVVGINGTAAQIFRGAPADHPGYFGAAYAIRECSAVTGACLMTRREVFETLGGFDETFAVNFNDVDYCLRVRERGFRVVFTPYARLMHHEFATREREKWPPEAERFRRRWVEPAWVDPYYNPNLSLRHTDCSVRL
jgi:GT2 family glycosyltransferase